ncbi:MAG: hypothetical protein GXX90_11280 [Microbacteriaceae bacterium]|nr:hypothetical protein [Microbacteriaceae bacterium]
MPTIADLAASASLALAATEPAEPGAAASALENPVLLVIGGIVLVALFGGIVLRTLRRNRLRR